jgi:succinate dehydrogenase / fumarate reductase, cytochrome b subunit
MRVLQTFSTSVGSKILVAFTGLALVGFLAFHLAGNLLLFLGPEEYNGHAHWLISNPLIVPAELGLVAVFLLHIGTAVRHVLRGRAARPTSYTKKKWAGGASRKTLASTSMILTGLVMLVFVVWHLKTFKYGPVYLSGNGKERDLYRLLVEVFRAPGYVGLYCGAMVLIGLHLRHGISSAAQSLGLMPRSWTGTILRAGAALAVVVAAGFFILPLWILVFLR